jgi:Na+-driven multidrug efflux pump
MQGIIKGLGVQEEAKDYAVIFMCCVSLPMAILLGLYCGYGLEGMWYGFCLGTLALGLKYQWLIMQQDWEAISRKIRSKQDEEATTAVIVWDAP